MIEVPIVRPVTTPLMLPMVATVGLLLVHIPPPTLLPNVVVVPAQALLVPVMAPGASSVVNTVVVRQPVPSVYDIVAVPVATVVTMPDVEPIVATPVLSLVHIPPPVALVRVVLPEHNDVVPPIAAGFANTDMVRVARQPLLNV
jgi:hypothetical protein